MPGYPSAIETRSLPTLTRSYPCRFTFYVGWLIGVVALISAGYCFWLMTVPLSYDWVPVVLIGFVVAIGVFLISVINFICRPYAIAAISSCIECSGDHADHLTSRISSSIDLCQRNTLIRIICFRACRMGFPRS